jgi:hypothetical protein
MLVDSDYTCKSGDLGTSMFSRSGKKTIFQYLCFNKNDNETENTGDKNELEEYTKEFKIDQNKYKETANANTIK